jgi:hypothetical protein
MIMHGQYIHQLDFQIIKKKRTHSLGLLSYSLKNRKTESHVRSSKSSTEYIMRQGKRKLNITVNVQHASYFTTQWNK